MSDINLDSHNKNKKGLGRGLGSLLGGPQFNDNGAGAVGMQSKSAAELSQSAGRSSVLNSQTMNNLNSQVLVKDENRVWTISIDKLVPGKYQPRKSFDKEALSELAQSIKQNGILQPIITRKVGEKFEIIAGERRWRAAQAAGLHDVPAIVREYNDNQSLELSIIENIQREDLNAIEEAEGYLRLAQEFGLSQQVIAEKVGKDRATVSNAMRILTLPEELKKFVISKELSVGHAKVLLSLERSDDQIKLGKKVVKEKMSVRKLEKLVTDILNGLEIDGEESEKTAHQQQEEKAISALQEKLMKKFGTKTVIDYKNGAGKLTISFFSKDEFNNIIEMLDV